VADLTRFDFHALRFNKSEAVQMMSAEEVGQYILLLVEAWLGGKDASLPNDPKLLARLARVHTVSDRVLQMFPIVETQWGARFRNETLYGEWMLARNRSENGRSAVESRWEKQRNTDVYTGVSKPVLPKPNQSVPSQTKPIQSSDFGQCSFKNIAVQYSSYFGRSHSHAKQHVEKYQLACSKYGEDKVLEYFKRWAEDSGWLRDRRDSQGLNLFWRPLDEMIEGDALREEREQNTSQSEQTEKVEVTLAMAADQSKRDEEVQKELTRIAKEKEFAEQHRYEI